MRFMPQKTQAEIKPGMLPDNDGVDDDVDAFPNNPNESIDTALLLILVLIATGLRRRSHMRLE
jgi:hypothetical protein